METTLRKIKSQVVVDKTLLTRKLTVAINDALTIARLESLKREIDEAHKKQQLYSHDYLTLCNMVSHRKVVVRYRENSKSSVLKTRLEKAKTSWNVDDIVYEIHEALNAKIISADDFTELHSIAIHKLDELNGRKKESAVGGMCRAIYNFSGFNQNKYHIFHKEGDKYRVEKFNGTDVVFEEHRFLSYFTICDVTEIKPEGVCSQ